MWAPTNTTMPSHPRKPRPISSAHILRAAPTEVSITRLFTPSDLDVNDLAEAIRKLLQGGTDAWHGTARPAGDLLSARPRVTHVVEATETQ